MEYRYIHNNIEFKVICDVEEVKMEIDESRDEYTEGLYQELYTNLSDARLSEEGYNTNIDTMHSYLEDFLVESSLNKFIIEAVKKKNGTFCAKRIVHKQICKNSIISEYSGWDSTALIVKAIDDVTLEIYYDRVTV